MASVKRKVEDGTTTSSTGTFNLSKYDSYRSLGFTSVHIGYEEGTQCLNYHRNLSF